MEDLRAFIRAQLDFQGQELDLWAEAVEKAVNIKVKALLQSFYSTSKIDSRCPRESSPAEREEKDSGKTKSTDTPSVDTSNSKFQQISIY